MVAQWGPASGCGVDPGAGGKREDDAYRAMREGEKKSRKEIKKHGSTGGAGRWGRVDLEWQADDTLVPLKLRHCGRGQ